jgi:hypothetical protein
MRYLTIGTYWKGENDYALDFVKYHRLVGVEHFVIFSNSSEDDYSLEKLMEGQADVEIIRWSTDDPQRHQAAWGALIAYNQGKTKWLALIDADQCLVPVQTNDVREILKGYEDFASLQLNWKAFGSGWQDTKLPGSVYERFIMTSENDGIYNAHCQFICQPDRTLPIKTAEPHYPLLPPGEVMVNTNKQPIDPTYQCPLNPGTPLSFNVPPLHDVMWVAHYTNKSQEEWAIKNSKGRADIDGAFIPTTQFDEYESICNQIKEFRPLEIWDKRLKLVKELEEKSYKLGYYTSIWESTPAGVGLSTAELNDLEEEVAAIEAQLRDLIR